MQLLTSADYLALASNIGTMSTAEQEEAIRALNAMVPELCRRDYGFYVAYTNRFRWIPGRFHMYLARAVQEFVEAETGRAYDILLIHTPPQMGKSMTVTEALPSWIMGRWPDKRQIDISYNDATALRFTKANREKLQEYGPALFGVSLDRDLNRADAFRAAGSRGYLISRGIGSGITSFSADVMLLDDPVKSSGQADSELNRERANLEWNMTLKTRLQPGAKCIVIMTRWHETDLGGYILKNEDPACVKVVNLPCEAEENDPLGRAPGEALAPEIGRDNAWMEQFKRGFMTAEGLRAWTAMYQCRPTSQEGNLLKRHWWKRYRRNALPGMIQQVMSVDASFKDNRANDFVSIQLWGKRNADIYLIDRDKRRLDFPATLSAIRGMADRHGYRGIILVEDKANGSAIVQTLGREIPGVVAVNPEGGKIARVNAVSHVIEAGNVWLPHEDDAPWAADFIDECAQFPGGRHDDDVDAMSQALRRFIYFDATVPEECGGEEDDTSGYDSFLNYGI